MTAEKDSIPKISTIERHPITHASVNRLPNTGFENRRINTYLSPFTAVLGYGLEGVSNAVYACRWVVENLGNELDKLEAVPSLDNLNLANRCYRQIDDAVRELFPGSGTVVISATFFKNSSSEGEELNCVITWVGDCFAYLIHEGCTTRLTVPINKDTAKLSIDELSEAMDYIELPETAKTFAGYTDSVHTVTESFYRNILPAYLGTYKSSTSNFNEISSTIAVVKPGDKVVLLPRCGLRNLQRINLLKLEFEPELSLHEATTNGSKPTDMGALVMTI